MALKLTITMTKKPKMFPDLGNTKVIYYKLEFNLIMLTTHPLVFYGATTFDQIRKLIDFINFHLLFFFSFI